MTLPNQQDAINLRESTPIVIDLVDDNPVDILLDVLEEDGQTLIVALSGAGSAPSDVVNTHQLVDFLRALFTRDNGVAGPIQQIFSFPSIGPASVNYIFVAVDGPRGTECYLRATRVPPGGLAYRVKLISTRIRF